MFMVNVGKYTSPMDPLGYGNHLLQSFLLGPRLQPHDAGSLNILREFRDDVTTGVSYKLSQKGSMGWEHLQLVLGRSSQDVEVVNNHGDRKSPKWGYSPSKWTKWLVNGGY